MRLHRGGKGGPAGGRFGLAELPDWFGRSIELWGLASGLLGLALAFGHSVISLFFLLGAGVAALSGSFIFLKNGVPAFKDLRSQFEDRYEYEIKGKGADLRYLDDVVYWGQQEIGPVHPDSQTITDRLGENQGVLNVYVRERTDGRHTFCGYVLVYPIDSEAGEALETGKARCEAELGPGSLCASFHDAPHLYVAMVLGIDKHARPHVKDKLRSLLIGMLESGDFDKVFARPGSRGGLQMMQHYGFLPIGDPADVWCVSALRLKRKLLAEQALSTAIVADPSMLGANVPRGSSSQVSP